MPNYPYTRNIPNGPNNPSVDQPVMQTNANSTDSILDVDLFGFNDNNGGLHQQSTYVVQGGNPVPTNTNGAQGIIYSKTVSGVAEIFVTRFGNATPVQLTKGSVTTGGNQSNGKTFLPGGIILQWGIINYTGTAALSFPSAFPTACFNVVITPGTSAGPVGISAGTISASGFTINTSAPASFSIFFFAIGN